MSNLNHALRLAENGYEVFPVQPGKKIPMGFLINGHKAASSDLETVRKWWTWHPNCSVAISLDNLPLTVIDVDERPGEYSGSATLANCGFSQTTSVSGTSLSGNGTHYWYRGATTCSNGYLLGVDRKSHGGYVVAPYDLPPIEEIEDEIPEWALLNTQSSREHVSSDYSGSFDEWAASLTFDNPRSEVDSALAERTQVPFGYGEMLSAVWQAVAEGAQGVSGMDDAILGIRERWLSGQYDTDENQARFNGALQGALRKWGPWTKGNLLHPSVEDLILQDPAARIMDSVAAEYDAAGIPVAQMPQADDPEIAEYARKVLIQRRGVELANELESPQPLVFVSMSEVLKLTPPKSIWNDMLFDSSIAILAATGNSGKSTFCIGLALAAGNPGVEVLNAPVTQGRVLFILGEGMNGFQNRVKAYERYWQRPLDVDHIDVLSMQGINNTSMEKILKVQKQSPYDMIVVDTLSTVFSIENENDNAEVSRLMRWLRELQKAGENTLVLVNHHTTNMIDAKGHRTVKARGASAIRDNADTVLVMTNDSGQISLSTSPEDSAKQREAAPKKITGVTLRDSKPGVVIAYATAMEDEKRNREIRDFLQPFLRESEWTWADLRMANGFSERRFRDFLASVMDEDDCDYVMKGEGKRGKYMLTDEGKQFLFF